MQFGKYLKTAFINRWNLLAFWGGIAFGVLSGSPDVVVPLVLAGEAAYLGLLGTHPKFQKYVDAQEAKAARKVDAVSNQQALMRITKALPRELYNRFESLRTKCLELRQLAHELKHPGKGSLDLPFDDFQVSGLDRLLWIYLRLLYTQFALERFLKSTSQDQIEKDIARLEQQLREIADGTASVQGERFKKALEDNLETSRARLTNLSKARENYELVKLEIDRLENKIRSLSELAINRHEPEFITSQVDQVASSMLETERTMNELQFATGLETFDDTAPELLEAKVVKMRR